VATDSFLLPDAPLTRSTTTWLRGRKGIGRAVELGAEQTLKEVCLGLREGSAGFRTGANGDDPRSTAGTR